MLSLDWNKSLLSTEGSGSSQLYSFSQTALIRFLLTIWVILRGLWHIAHRFTAASYGKKFFFFFRPLRQMRWLLLGLVTLSYWLLSMVLFLEVCFHGVCHVSTITLNGEMIVWNVFFFSLSALSASWRTQKSGGIWRDETKLHPGADQGYPRQGEGLGGELAAVLPPHQTDGRHAWGQCGDNSCLKSGGGFNENQDEHECLLSRR